MRIETVSNLGGCRPLVRAADRVEHRESEMIRVVMTYRLCPPRLEMVSTLCPHSLIFSRSWPVEVRSNGVGLAKRQTTLVISFARMLS
jgi:hypothetical protein